MMGNILNTLSIIVISILMALFAYYKHLYDKEVVLHTLTKEELTDRSRALQEVSNSLDVCKFEATLTNTAVINICKNNKEVDEDVKTIKEAIYIVGKGGSKSGGSEEVIYVDRIDSDIDRLLSEGWDRIYKNGGD